jgi:DNA-binding MarR family transcriptional regulator
VPIEPDEVGTRQPRLEEQLMSAANRFIVVARGDLRKVGITLSQARTLSALFRRGPQRITRLAEFEQVTQPAMTSLVNTLERTGLVERRVDEADRRAVVVALTDAGEQAMRRVRAARIGTVADFLESLDPASLEALRQGLPALERLNEEIRRSRQ